MKLVRETYKLLASDAFKSILLIIQTAGFIVLFNISIGTVNTAKILSDKVQNTSLKNAYYYSYGQAGIKDISEIDALNDVYFPSYFNSEFNGQKMTAYCYSDSFLIENQLKLKNGGKIERLQKNECIISSDLAETANLKKGSKLKFTYNCKTLELTVIGVLHRDEQIIKFTVSGSDLTLKSIYIKPQNTVIFTSCDAVLESDMTAFPCGIYKNTDALTEKEIINKFGGYGEITPFARMLNEETVENRSIVMLFNSLAIVLLIVSFVNVTVNNFLILKLQEKRFAVYFLCGMSFGEIIKIISLRSAILTGISYLVSFSTLSALRRFSYIDEFSFNALSFILSLILTAVITGVSEIPIYAKMKNTEPIRYFAESPM